MQLQTQVYITYRFIHQKGAEKLVKDIAIYSIYVASYVATYLTQQFWMFEVSAEDVPSD